MDWRIGQRARINGFKNLALVRNIGTPSVSQWFGVFAFLSCNLRWDTKRFW
jgi:hypothetical protein